MNHLPRLALVTVLTLASAACITETEDGRRVPRGMQTQGVVVSATPDAVWSRTQAVLASMTNEPLESRGVERSAVTTIRGKEVRVLVEPHVRGAAFHVTSADQVLADTIRLRVLR